MDLPINSAIAMRKSEEDFEDWRRLIRRLVRDSEGEESMDRLRERVEDELLPAQRRVQRAVERSPHMVSTLKDQAATTVISGSATALGAVVVGANPVVSGAAALGAGVLQWIWKAYRPQRPEGAEAVMASLLRR